MNCYKLYWNPLSFYVWYFILNFFSGCSYLALWNTYGLALGSVGVYIVFHFIVSPIFCIFTFLPQNSASDWRSSYTIRLLFSTCAWLRKYNIFKYSTDLFGRYHPISLIIAGAFGKVMCRQYCMVSRLFLEAVIWMLKISLMNFILHVRDGCYVRRLFGN